MIYLALYLLLVNALGLLLMCVDKQKARRKKLRVPESTLMAVAALGGSLGALGGMYLFRHKTRHPKFYIGLPLLLALHLVLAALLLLRPLGWVG